MSKKVKTDYRKNVSVAKKVSENRRLTQEKPNPNANLNPFGWTLYFQLGNPTNQVIYG